MIDPLYMCDNSSAFYLSKMLRLTSTVCLEMLDKKPTACGVFLAGDGVGFRGLLVVIFCLFGFF